MFWKWVLKKCLLLFGSNSLKVSVWFDMNSEKIVYYCFIVTHWKCQYFFFLSKWCTHVYEQHLQYKEQHLQYKDYKNKRNLTIPKLCPNSLSQALGLQINKKMSKISQPKVWSKSRAISMIKSHLNQKP